MSCQAHLACRVHDEAACMQLADLLSFLGLPGSDAAELVTLRGRGYFHNIDKLIAAAQQGDAHLTVHPFTHDCTTDQVGPHIQQVKPRAFGTIAARFHHPTVYDAELGEVSTETMARHFAEGNGALVVWSVPSQDAGYILAAVDPFPFRDDLEEGRQEWLAQVRGFASANGFEEAMWQIVDAVPLDGGYLKIKRARAPSMKSRRLIYREMPERIRRILSKSPDGKLAKLFHSRQRSLGTDVEGNMIPATQENFDREFVKALCRAKEDFNNEEIIDAFWRRPGNTVRTNGGLRAVEAFVMDMRDEVERERSKLPKAPQRGVAPFQPGETLFARLYGLYLQPSEATGGFVQRHDVEIAHKADVVLQYLVDNGAAFYYFKALNETMFTLDGRPVLVDVEDQTYQSWFVQTVQLFSPIDQQGKALTLALRIKIQNYAHTRKSERSLWGHYDKDNQTLYFCFDPEHMQVTKVVAATPDTGPNVIIQPNGTDGVTLRGMQKRVKALELQPEAMRMGWMMFVNDIHHGQALPEGHDGGPNYRLMSTIFNLVSLLPNHRQRPLKLHCGTEGSGKTSAANDFGYVLYGSIAGVEYDAPVVLSRDLAQGGPYLVQDNAEATRARAKFNQIYLVMTTGGSNEVRKLYTTADSKTFAPNGSLCVTSVEGFHRPEELRRIFGFDFSRRFWDPTHEDLGTRADRMERNSDLMLSALLEMFSLRVLPSFEDRFQKCLQWLKTPRIYQLLGTKKPFVGWLARMLAMTEACGDLFVRDPAAFHAREVFERWLHALYRTDGEERLAADPNYDLLEALRNEGYLQLERENLSHINLKDTGQVGITARDGSLVIGPVTTGALLRAFGAISRRNGIQMEQRTSQALGRRMKAISEQPLFAQSGWERREIAPHRNGSMQYEYIYTNPNTPALPDSEVEAGTKAGSVIDKINE